jgi:hypothetical protein
MNREIKFRVWNNYKKEMSPCFEIEHLPARYKKVVENQPGSAFLQYTGLRDKSGHEIYESDLIVNGSRNGKRPHKVEFLDGKFVGIYGKLCYDLYCELHEIEIVGNVSENPELLEKMEAVDE